MRNRQTTGIQQLLRRVQALQNRGVIRHTVQRAALEVLGPLAREVSLTGLDSDGLLRISCQSASARERVQSIEPILLAQLTALDDVQIRRVQYRIDTRAGREHVPSRLIRQLRAISPEQQQEIEEIASGMQNDVLRARLTSWMTMVAQLDASDKAESVDSNTGPSVSAFDGEYTKE
ncbi:MAG: hypothetical protein VX223_14480 [Myxococcota bacterium]|nr:hypothetical protein [Myxococcota bacterium]